jgi:tail protein
LAHYCATPAVLTLTLGAATLDLMDAANGFAVEQLDFGYPNVREDISPIPDRNGSWDDTAWFGQRVVSIKGTLLPTSAGSRSKTFDTLAPFLVPSARPTLTFAVDADTSPRFFTLRAAQLSAPASNPTLTAFSAQWVAADPAAYSIQMNVVTVGATGGGQGRIYVTPQTGTVTNTSAWTPPRVYPVLSGGLNVSAVNQGDLRTPPLIQVFGPCTNPAIYDDTVGAVIKVGTATQPLTLAAGDVLTVDGRGRLVYLGTPASSRYNYVDFTVSSWWLLAPGPNALRYVADIATPASYASVAWNDAYL